ncbi:MAG TPA: methyltransferase domain-containing protein [Candidatus Paceibacterota bacterium]|nr:methyltransferase domain-containing protein [Verrucomicrobiota bacterium]HOX04018.1 methyltransferase domain-containing protein [Verrucomicrobiota bacterium]HRZ46912.1 methyltransferase domain-containing protein [Candidatus Paceibacterota bacterium]HRZ92463.1 methyltransferase domain-containing protein [Candidatus Paceibacterota bacterium]
MSTLKFFRNFIRHPQATGAIAASSSRLAALITDSARLEDARVVLEFGPGTGVFTERIVSRLAPGARFLAIEINPEFAAATRRRCPGVQVVEGSAVDARIHLQALGETRCDRVVSGLPWAAFPEALQDQLLATLLAILRPGGLFLTFAYPQGVWLPAGRRFRRKLMSRFAEVRTTRIVWLNLPPAFVYVARNGLEPPASC